MPKVITWAPGEGLRGTDSAIGSALMWIEEHAVNHDAMSPSDAIAWMDKVDLIAVTNWIEAGLGVAKGEQIPGAGCLESPTAPRRKIYLAEVRE